MKANRLFSRTLDRPVRVDGQDLDLFWSHPAASFERPAAQDHRRYEVNVGPETGVDRRFWSRCRR
jgi:hypothetical protein